MHAPVLRRRGLFATLGVIAIATAVGLGAALGVASSARPAAPSLPPGGALRTVPEQTPSGSPPSVEAVGPSPTVPPGVSPAGTPLAGAPPAGAPPAGAPAAGAPPAGTTPAALACPGWAGRRASAATSTAPAGFALHVPILMYHRIIPPILAGHSLPDLVVPPNVFAAQMAALDAAGWRTITAGQLASDLQQGVRPPPRTFVITFDDGHADGYTYAFPALLAHHFVATYFIVPGRIGQADDLTAGQVHALSAAGMEIADHSMDHVNLAHLGPSGLSKQVVGAAARIAAITGCWPSTLAYPYGQQDPAVVQFIADAGFLLAVTEKGSGPETWATRLLSSRLRVSPTTTPTDLVLRVRRFAALASSVQRG